MTEPASVAPRHFFALSWGTLVPPLALVLFAALPILLLLRVNGRTAYADHSADRLGLP